MKRAMIVWMLACACGAPAKQQPVASPASPPPEPVETQPPPPPPPRPPPPQYQTGVAECDAVIVAYEKLFSCDKFRNMPQEAIDAQRKGLDTMKSSWHFDTEEMQQAARPGCLAALDGLAQSAKAMGCEL
jgi:hypothetical protein